MKIGDLVELLGYPYIGIVKKVYVNYENGDNILVVVTADGMQWNRSESQFCAIGNEQ